MTIPASAIRSSYLLPYNAAMVVHELARRYGERITISELKDRWEREVETCAPLRGLGERPEKGFEHGPKVELVSDLLKALARSEGEAA